MMVGGIFLLRRRPGYAPAYRVWGYPLVPAVFVVASATIVVNRLVSQPLDSAAGLGLVALGVPAYLLWSRRAQNLTGSPPPNRTIVDDTLRRTAPPDVRSPSIS
jgi:APA family basic amino acid/polyamine antiporter